MSGPPVKLAIKPEAELVCHNLHGPVTLEAAGQGRDGEGRKTGNHREAASKHPGGVLSQDGGNIKARFN